MPVGVPREVMHLPAFHAISDLERLGIPHEPDEPDERGGLVAKALDVRLGRPMEAEVGGHQLLVALLAPRPQALRVVVAALEHRRAAQRREIRRSADVVGMEMRDYDALDRAVQLAEDTSP